MASSESKAKSESDVTPAGEETLHFDDNTSKGKESVILLPEIVVRLENCSVLIFTVLRELG